nr:class I SAM-dependent methyltransferase [Oceanococcus sp. HetDA_MAG_MS8]
MSVITLAESGLIPDGLIRMGVRRISRRRLKEEYALTAEQRAQARAQRLAEWHAGPIAVQTQAANDQHYEVPPAFFDRVLGAHRKYSCCWFDASTSDLDAAEAKMLEMTAERAGIVDGMTVLDLGCGWGSFALWAAGRFPKSTIIGVSNSNPQREFIMDQARQRGLSNLEIRTCDINDFAPDEKFDRVVSIEMMEHVRNHPKLFARIATWLKPDGALFTHVFCHKELTYAYEDRGDGDWMARHFFSGGMMPSYDLFCGYDRDLDVVQRWWVSGTHYEDTSNAWLERCDAHRKELVEVLGGGAQGRLRLQRWRMFFLAVAEFFGIDGGEQWGVGHYLLKPKSA